ncbi:MAG: sodium:panthothenate symporter, partial [Lentisphaeria bacterium]|nr:sodium:panthothenate symporter [Lentisphaeria bacterium]
LYYQLMLPVTMRNIMPKGMMGLFCLLMILLMISTDDTRIFSAAITISQDVILPFRKKQLTPREHMWMVRWVAIGIGVFFFLGSSFMAQLDYINLFVTLMCTMWVGGCGPMLIFGLYGRFGTTIGAWVSLLTGVFMGLIGVFVQRNWAEMVYPFLRDHGMLDGVTKALWNISKPLHPYVVWEMNAVKCPINSYEWYFITMLVTLILYIGVSYATLKEPFNLDRMLHRGKYSLGEERQITSAWSWSNFYNKMIGITPEYTTGDKIITWSYFFYSFIYRFGVTFVVVVIWNIFYPWPLAYWGWYFLIVYLIVPGVMAAITAVWFGIGGSIDLYRMFRDLENRTINLLDDGRVEGNMSLADKAELEAVDRAEKEQAQAKSEEK